MRQIVLRAESDHEYRQICKWLANNISKEHHYWIGRRELAQNNYPDILPGMIIRKYLFDDEEDATMFALRWFGVTH